jgi:long-subunit acyl-CoA synthetase (AMP-forming)
MLTRFSDDTLRHCLNIAHATAIISTPDLSEFINEPLQHFSINLKSFPGRSHLEKSSITYVNLQTLPVPAVNPAAKAALDDLSVLVYTSGTTGKTSQHI